MAKPRLRGFSLIELIVVMSMMMIILSLTGMSFHLLTRTERAVAQSFVTERAISRLAVQFRDDVHRSNEGTISSNVENAIGELNLRDSRGIQVRYLAASEIITRFLIKNDKIVSRDDFRLPECRVSIAAGDQAESKLRRLVIERPGAVLIQKQQVNPPLRQLNIEAYLRPQDVEQSTVKSKSESTPVIPDPAEERP